MPYFIDVGIKKTCNFASYNRVLWQSEVNVVDLLY